MILTLDGQRLDTPHTPDTTLETLIQAARAGRHDRLIVAVSMNGHTLGEAELNAALVEPVAADAQVDLQSGDTHELVCAALRGLALEFQEAGAQQEQIADKLSAGATASAVQDVGQYIALWQTCFQALVQCSGLLGTDLSQREHHGQPLHAWFQDATTKLTGIRDALSARDMTLLTDLVRYEVPALCQTWQRLLDGLANQLDATAATR